MLKLIDKLNRFNYSKTGVVAGFAIGAITTLMGIYLLIINGIKKEYFLLFISLIVLAIGVSAISMEIFRLRKIRADKV